MEEVIANIDRVSDLESDQFKIALHQFSAATTGLSESNEKIRLDYPLMRVYDTTILSQVDGRDSFPVEVANMPSQQVGSQYTFVEALQISEDFQHERKSSKRKEDPKRISYKSPSSGEDASMHELTRATSTWTSGLYSSVLAASNERFPSDNGKALLQADIICNVLNKEVADMSFVRQTALQMANIALRAVLTLDAGCQEKVFRAFFRPNRANLASSTKDDTQSTLDDASKTW
ncbi:hypothetical protein DFQ30_001688 [Apophysomyces sp. BC1015]|nr:hypothetical protein DFQ30_001688 [Apophysomyces sp. BC1015]